MSTPIISLKNVSKHFNAWTDRPETIKHLLVRLAQGSASMGGRHRVDILKDVSFDIYPGEFVGIMGRNGVGKSTLLKIISGIYPPSSGEVIIRGKVAPLLELGAGFAPDLSGYDNIFLNGAILGFGRVAINQLVKTIVEFSELEERIYLPVKNYSSGMLMRLGFSIACHLDSPILLFDEVLAVGDVAFQQKCLAKVGELHREGRAIILVTHSPNDVMAHCNRSLIFAHQQLIYDGAPVGGVGKYLEGVSTQGAPVVRGIS